MANDLNLLEVLPEKIDITDYRQVLPFPPAFLFLVVAIILINFITFQLPTVNIYTEEIT